jgi:hypothetical protein
MSAGAGLATSTSAGIPTTDFPIPGLATPMELTEQEQQQLMVEAGDKSVLDRVRADHEDDWSRCGSRLGLHIRELANSLDGGRVDLGILLGNST